MNLSSRVTKLNNAPENTKSRYVLSYAGILWCFGKHDRPWFEREIFGTIRYMTSRSMAKKFDARRYMESV